MLNYFQFNTAQLNAPSQVFRITDSLTLQSSETMVLSALLSVLDNLAVQTTETTSLAALLSTTDTLALSAVESQQLLVTVFGTDVLSLTALEHAALLRTLLLPTKAHLLDTSLRVVALPVEGQPRLQKGGVNLQTSRVFNIKRNDTWPTMRRRLEQADGSPINLTGATVRLLLRDPVSAVTHSIPATISNALLGEVSVSFTTAHTNIARQYRGEFEITFSAGAIATAPSDGYFTVNVLEDLG